MEVYTFDKLSDHIGKSPQAQYLFSYLGELNAKTFFIESDYVDKDFLIDYAKFYARSFQAPRRLTKRIHFFSRDFTTESFRMAIEKYDGDLIQNIRESYLGFTVVKPIGNRYGDPLIGRTILKTYPEKVEPDFRYFLTFPPGSPLP